MKSSGEGRGGGVGHVPAYQRIADALRERIAADGLAPHDPLPAERELAAEFAVSRMTLRQALGILQSEGLVYRGSTRGTFVAEHRVALRLGSFSHEVTRSGRNPGAEVMWAERIEPTHEVAVALGLTGGQYVVALQRLRRSDSEPLALETTYYPESLVPGLLEADLTGSLWTELEARFGIVPARSSASVEVVVLDAESAERLDAGPTAPGLQLTRSTFDAAGRCVEYARDVYRAERVTLTIDRSFTD